MHSVFVIALLSMVRFEVIAIIQHGKTTGTKVATVVPDTRLCVQAADGRSALQPGQMPAQGTDTI